MSTFCQTLIKSGLRVKVTQPQSKALYTLDFIFFFFGSIFVIEFQISFRSYSNYFILFII